MTVKGVVEGESSHLPTLLTGLAHTLDGLIVIGEIEHSAVGFSLRFHWRYVLFSGNISESFIYPSAGGMSHHRLGTWTWSEAR